MNKVVYKELLAAELPEELRDGIPPDRRVRVRVEEVAPVGDTEERLARFRRYVGAARDRGTTVDEAVERIRQLRDEWD